jgi:hypothetical protein
MTIGKSNPKMQRIKLDDIKVYTKSDLARMLNEYCEHLVTSIMRAEDHISINDYIENPQTAIREWNINRK